jgi:hypothetical protein
MAGLWRQHELWDGTYTYVDFLDIQEMLLVQNENRRRDFDHAEQKRKLQAVK